MEINEKIRKLIAKSFYNQQAVIDALCDSDNATFLRAAREAARYRDAAAVEPIVRRIFDPNDQVADAARKALDEINPHWNDTLNATRIWLNLILSSDAQTRVPANEQLDTPSPAARAQSSHAEQLLPTALQALQQQSQNVRLAAIEVLAQVGGEAYATHIIGVLADQSHVVSETARLALARLKWHPKTETQAALYEKNLPYESVSIKEATTIRTFLVERKKHPYNSLTNVVFEADFVAADRWEAIDKMLFAMYYRSGLQHDDLAAIKAVLKKRESSMSTGVGAGLAIPHASSDLTPLTIGWFRCPQGLNWEALDNQPVNYIVCYLVPQGQFEKHLRTLADIAVFLPHSEVRGRADKCTNTEEWRYCIIDAIYASQRMR